MYDSTAIQSGEALRVIPDFPELLCTRCNEHWPADTEFFYSDRSRPSGLAGMCKACYAELPSTVRRRGPGVHALASSWEHLFSDRPVDKRVSAERRPVDRQTQARRNKRVAREVWA